MVFRRAFLLLIQVCLALSVCSQANASSHNATPDTGKALSIAITSDYPPFMAELPDGQPTGLILEMWRAWSETTGTPIEFVSSDWAGTLENLKSGKADIHSGMFSSAERKAWIDFSEPIHEIKTAIYSRRVDGGEVTLKSLNGQKVGVLKGGFQEQHLRDTAPDIILVPFEGGRALVRALLAGEVRAIVHEVPAVQAELAKLSLGGAVLRNTDGGFGNFLRAGVRKGASRLLQQINDGFAAIPAQILAEIEKRWLPNPLDHFFVGASGAMEFTAAEKEWLAEHPVIHLAVTTFIKPVDILTSSGEYSGLNADLINLLNRKLGVTIVPDFNRKWGDVVDKVMTGRVDGAFSLSRTPEREENILFTRPYAFDSIVVVVRKGDERIRQWEDLAGRTVSVTKGMAVAEMLKDVVGKGRIVEVETETNGLKQLFASKIDAHISYLLPYGNAQRENKVSGVGIAVQKNVEGGTLRIGVPKDRPELYSILRKGLNATTHEELTEIRNRWLFPDTLESSSRISLSPAEQRWLEAHGKIRVQNEQDWAPFNFTDLGQPAGYSIDYIKLLAKKIGIKIEFVSGPTWAGFMEMIKTGHLDVMVNITKTPDREKFIHFTQPFAGNPSVIVVRDDEDRIKVMSDLKGLSVAVPEGFFYQEIIQRKHPAIKLHLVKSQTEALQAVSQGYADAAVGGVAVVTHLIRENLLTNLRLAGGTGDEDLDNELSIGVRQDWPMMRTILDKAIRAVTPEELAKLRETWLGSKREPIDERVSLNDGERRWLSIHKNLRLGVDPSWPPFDFVEGNVHQGLSADVLSTLALRLGLDFKRAEGLTWNEVLDGAKNRKLDLISLCNDTPERRKYLSFTQPIASVPSVIATRSDFRTVRNLTDLSDDKIALVKGHAIQDIVRAKFPNLPIQEVETPLDGLNAVASGDMDAYVGNLGVINHLVRKNNLHNVKVAANAGFPNQQLRICVRSDWPQLVRILNKGLASISKDDLWAIQEKWMSLEVSAPEDAEDEALISGPVLWLAGAAVLVFVALVFLVRILMRSSKGDALAFQLGSLRFRVLILSTLGVFAAVVLVLAWVGLNHNKEKMLASVGGELNVVQQSTADRLDMWVKERSSFLAQFGRNIELVTIAARLLQVPPDRETLMASAPLREARAFFRRNSDQFGDLGFFIISPDGVSIGSRRDTNIGTPNFISEQRRSLIDLVWGGKTVLIPPLRSDVSLAKTGETAKSDKKPPTMFFATPIQEDDGSVLAILTQRIDPQQEFSRVLHSGRIGETGETYAFDEDGLMLSQSRFDKELKDIGLMGEGESSSLNVMIRDPGQRLSVDQPHRGYDGLPLTRMANAAVTGQAGVDLDGYRDYRGVPVLGAWTWMEDLGLGVATEIDQEEALSTYETFRITVLGVLAITLILSAGSTLFTLALGERTSRSLMRAKDELEDRVLERTRELEDSENRIRSIIENAVDGIIVIGEKGIVESFSPAAEAIFGYAVDDVVGQNISMLMPKRDALEHDGHLSRYLETGEGPVVGRTSEVVGQRRNGEEFPMDLAVGVAYLGDEQIYTGIVRDITQRKEAEDALARSEERTRRLLESVGEGVFGVDTSGKITFANPAVVEILGYSVEEMLGQNSHTLFHHHRSDGAGYPEEECSMFKSLQTGEAYRVDDEVFWRKDGVSVEVEYHSTPIRKDDEVIGAVLAFADVSERKEAQRQLAEAEERARLLLESVGEGVFGVDLEGRMTFVNPQVETMLGYSTDDMIGEKAHALFHHTRADGSNYPVEECWMFKSFTFGDSYRIDDEVLWRKDGSPLEIEYNATPIRRGDELIGAVISFSDISARKEAERKLQDAFDVIAGSIQYASRIQKSILPDPAFMASTLDDHFVLWKPRDVVGGDIYWCEPWAGGALVIMADCTGHGVPGAFMTLIASGALGMAKVGVMPGDVAKLVQQMHQIVQSSLGQDTETGESDDGLELGACLVSGDGHTMTFVGARFDLFVVEDGRVDITKGTRKGIGYRGIPHSQKYESYTLDLKEGQTFYMTSDGLIDQVGWERRHGFGKKRFKKLLLDIQSEAMPDQKERVYQSLRTHQGDEPRRDDVSVIGFRARKGGGAGTRGTRAKRRFVLDDQLRVGFGEIDGDHAKLFELIENFEESIRAQDHDEMALNLKELFGYTIWHFSHEEQLMRDTEYPLFEQHLQEHEALKTTVTEIKQKFEDGDDQILAGVPDILRDWVVSHIQRVDKLLGRFLAATMEKPD